MKRVAFLAPAALAGAGTALAATLLQLSATTTYALFGVVAVLVVGGGIIRDLFSIHQEHGVIVQMHQAAVGAEQYDGPEPRERRVRLDEWNEYGVICNEPVRVITGRAGFKTLPFKNLHKRSVVTFSHWIDPMLKQRA